MLLRFDADAFGPCFLTLRQVNLEDAVLITCLDLVRLNAAGHRHRAIQFAVARRVTVSVLRLGLVFRSNYQSVARELNVDFIRLETRRLGADDDFSFAILNVAAPARIPCILPIATPESD